MLKHFLAILVVALTVTVSNAQHEGHAKGNAKKMSGETFGEKINAKGAVSYEQMLKQLQGKDSIAVKVVGTVDAVCQMKGCWMTINEANKPEMMVKFKDYGFFVPKDISGRKVVMQGFAYREVTSVDELRHYAEDAGKSKEEIEKITQPKEELKFMASGVLLLDKKGK
ncbi:MAG: DUF4920 domain-containing protein [Saprospiraceae bacterium]